jgi:hypothetical protein
VWFIEVPVCRSSRVSDSRHLYAAQNQHLTGISLASVQLLSLREQGLAVPQKGYNVEVADDGCSYGLAVILDQNGYGSDKRYYTVSAIGHKVFKQRGSVTELPRNRSAAS